MADKAYPLWLQHVIDSWTGRASANPSGSLTIALLSSAYTYNDGDEFHSDLSGVLATATITISSTTGGVLLVANPEVTGLPATQITSAVIYWDTGVSGTSRVMLYLDDALGLPLTPSGTRVLVRLSDLASVGLFPIGGLLV